MSGNGRTARILATLGAVILVGGGAVSCAQQASDPGGMPPYSGVTPNPNNVPPDTTDYSVDAGNNMPEYEYEDEPEPAESIIATLCNLNQSFFSGLRTVESGVPVADDMLRTNLVGLEDLMSEWDGLRRHVPEAIADLDLADEIFANWRLAVVSVENGDESRANSAMNEAERALQQLPKEPAEYCSGAKP